MDRLNKDKNALRGTQHPGKNERLSHVTWGNADAQQFVNRWKRSLLFQDSIHAALVSHSVKIDKWLFSIYCV